MTEAEQESETHMQLMRAHIQSLQEENERLKLEMEISDIERRLSSLGHTSDHETPLQVQHGHIKRKVSTLRGRTLFASTPDVSAVPDYTRSKPMHGNSTSRQVHTRPEHRRDDSTSGSRSMTMKPATYDGTGFWLDYKAHFEACATINKWSEAEKGLYLAVSLRGQAQGVFGNLTSNSQNFLELSSALEDRFQPPNQTELYRCQLRDRRQKASESLSELAQDIRKLTNLAYPTAPNDVRETLSKEQFVDSLQNSDIRLKVKQARPFSLNDAVRHAVELEAYYRAERKKDGDRGLLYTATLEGHDSCLAETGLKSMTEVLTKLRNELQALKKEVHSIRAQHRSQHDEDTHTSEADRNGRYDKHVERKGFPRKCFECGSEQHLKRNCPRLVQRNSGFGRRWDQNDSDNNAARADDASPGSHDIPINTSGFKGAGLFVSGSIDSHVVDCLVDTGATLTLLSSNVWNNIGNNVENLCSFRKELVSASGDPINIKGITEVTLKVNDMDFICSVVVADVETDVILGLDFLTREKAEIDVVTRKLSLRGKICQMTSLGQAVYNRVVVSDKVESPSRSEKPVHGKVQSLTLIPEDMCLVEPAGISGKAICPVCKEVIPVKEKFETHVIGCAQKRLSCSKCKSTFKKKEYLVRHVKLKHDSVQGCPGSSVQTKEGNDSDWDEEPDIDITEKAQETAELGRIQRKRTSPLPVLAPIKKRKATVATEQQKKVSEDVLGTVSSSESEAEKQTEKLHRLDIAMESSVMAGMRQRSLNVSHDGVTVLSSSMMVPENIDMGSSRFQIGDFLERGVKIDPNDIDIELDGMKMKMQICYKK